MGSQKTHKVFVQMAKRIERMSCHNESCSAPSHRELKLDGAIGHFDEPL